MRITIQSKVLQQQLALIITDDGIGIEEERLAELNMSLGVANSIEERKAIGGIGLKNVNERIKLQYGQQYGLFVNSIVEQGTEVVLLLPLERRATSNA